MNSKIIVLIQNTHYHFETLISLYQLLKNLGYDAYIHRIIKNHFQQEEFLKFYDVKTSNKEILSNASCAFVVSAYPNPNVNLQDAVPNAEDWIFEHFKNRLIYISHRFKNKKDYENKALNKKNCLCLSPLSKKIGIDYINLTDSVVEPIFNPIDSIIKIGIQGHFHLANRDFDIINSAHLNYLDSKQKFLFNFIGTNSTQAVSKKIIKKEDLNIKTYQYIPELKFYDYLNSNHWLLSLLTPNLNNRTYSLERFSSNFNQALSLEKPIICHKKFKSIYRIPGLYYENEKTILRDIEAISNEGYLRLVKEIRALKLELMKHNNFIIEQKIHYVCKS